MKVTTLTIEVLEIIKDSGFKPMAVAKINNQLNFKVGARFLKSYLANQASIFKIDDSKVGLTDLGNKLANNVISVDVYLNKNTLIGEDNTKTDPKPRIAKPAVGETGNKLQILEQDMISIQENIGFGEVVTTKTKCFIKYEVDGALVNIFKSRDKTTVYLWSRTEGLSLYYFQAKYGGEIKEKFGYLLIKGLTLSELKEKFNEK